jgi:hypothetical protein
MKTPKKKPTTPAATRDPSPVRFQKTVDKLGTTWTLTPSKYSISSVIEIWVDRKPQEKFWIRQENKGHVDLIQLDLGQAYDVIRAFSEALDANN